MTSFNMQNKLHYQVPWFSFTEISLRTSWPLCKSLCDSFVLQNPGSAETPKSAFENALSVIFFFLFLLFFSETSANTFPVSAHIWNEVSLAVFHSHILNPRASWNDFLPLRFWLSLFFIYSGSFKCIHLNENLLLYCILHAISVLELLHTLLWLYRDVDDGLCCVAEHFQRQFQSSKL